MSDEEYEYEYSDEEGYQYSDEGENEGDSQEAGAGIALENTYYEAEDRRREDPARALELFARVVELEQQHRPDEVKFRFKSLEQMVLLNHRLGNGEQMVKVYEDLLGCLDKVTRNECNDTINNVLDTISAGKGEISLDRMYEITLDVLRKANNERLWFNTKLKQAKLYLDREEHDKLEQVIASLHQTLQSGQSKDDPNRDAYLLEVYALEIQMYSATRQKARLKEIWMKTKSLSAAVQDPRIFGGLHEAGGKMRMEEEAWSDAYDEFFESFRNYQEAGNPRAKQCLKYVVLANMIALKDINPFDSREAKVYKDDPEIQAMMELRQAFEASDVKQFEALLHDEEKGITQDPFIMRYVNSLLQNIRSQVLRLIVQPFGRVKVGHLAQEINIQPGEVEKILVQLILDGKIHGKLDQMNGIFTKEVPSEDPANLNDKYIALESWNAKLKEAFAFQ